MRTKILVQVQTDQNRTINIHYRSLGHFLELVKDYPCALAERLHPSENVVSERVSVTTVY